MNLEKLEEILENEPKYRLQQVRQAVFLEAVGSWDEVSTLPKNLREKLNKEVPLEIKAEVLESGDGRSRKALITLEDGEKIETVLMQSKSGRVTACVSSQVGCALGCSFCATGKMGFSRDLTIGEIVDQVLLWNRDLKKGRRNSRVDHVVVMGMGEPFLNYENVMEAIKVMNSEDGLGIGARKISISTVGIVPGILSLAESGLPINLAISLHASNDRLRVQLMPIAVSYSLKKIFEAVDMYIEKTNRKVMFEYLMIDGVNDDLRYARELVELFKRKSLYMLNLINYNQTGIYRPSRPEQIKRFMGILEKNHINATLRHSFGHDIGAACGQLAGARQE